jgi:hypothetical protein
MGKQINKHAKSTGLSTADEKRNRAGFCEILLNPAATGEFGSTVQRTFEGRLPRT